MSWLRKRMFLFLEDTCFVCLSVWDTILATNSKVDGKISASVCVERGRERERMMYGKGKQLVNLGKRYVSVCCNILATFLKFKNVSK